MSVKEKISIHFYYGYFSTGPQPLHGISTVTCCFRFVTGDVNKGVARAEERTVDLSCVKLWTEGGFE